MANLREFNRRYKQMNEDRKTDFEKKRDKEFLERCQLAQFQIKLRRSLYEYYYMIGNNIDVKYDAQIEEIVRKQREMSVMWFGDF
jgi:hypothetical protein